LASPALPLHTAGKYVAAAYVIVFAVISLYVGIMRLRVRKLERELQELKREDAGR
jgi:CcmD family protein